MAKLAAKTYGDALFELAVEEGRLDVFLEEVQAIADIFKQNADLNKLMNHPKIAKEEKTEIMENILKGSVCDDLVGFLKIIITKGRFHEVSEIFSYFLGRVKEYKKIGIAYVSTAAELKDAQKKEVEEKLLQTTHYNKMEIYFSVDTSLIGGMVIRIGDRVVDSSIKSRLNDLTRDLMKIQLA